MPLLLYLCQLKSGATSSFPPADSGANRLCYRLLSHLPNSSTYALISFYYYYYYFFFPPPSCPCAKLADRCATTARRSSADHRDARLAFVLTPLHRTIGFSQQILGYKLFYCINCVRKKFSLFSLLFPFYLFKCFQKGNGKGRQIPPSLHF